MHTGFRRVVTFVNNYSIWVMLGALSTGYFFCSYFRSAIHPVFYWLLASSMWMIYTFDHIADGRKHQTSRQLPSRYLQNFNQRKVLLPLMAFLTGLNACLAFMLLNQKIIISGTIMALLSMAYLFWVHQKGSILNPWLKEVFVALMATAGMGMLPLLESEAQVYEPHAILLLLIFFLINLINLMTFSQFDKHQDEALSFRSTALKNPSAQVSLIRRLLLLCYVLIAVWMFFLPGFRQFKALMVPLIMINALMIINIWEERFKEHGLYRFWGDFIYVMPGIMSLWFGI